MRAAFVFFGALLIRSAVAGGDVIEPRLFLGSVDVTGRYPATVVFSPQAIAGEARTPQAPIRCPAGSACNLPDGVYEADVESEAVLCTLRRPRVVVQRSDPANRAPLRIPVARTGRLRIRPGYPVPGSFVDVLSAESGLLFQHRVSENTRAIAVPAERIVVGVRDANLRPLGLSRLQPAPESEVEFPMPPRLARGRGQLLAAVRRPVEPGDDTRAPEARVLLVSGDRVTAPDVDVDTGAGRRAIFWLDAPTGPASLRIDSETLTTARPARVDVPEGVPVALLDVILVPRPALRITFGAPEERQSRPVSLDLLDCRAVGERPGPLALPLCKQTGSEMGTLSSAFDFRRLQPGAWAVRWRSGDIGGAERVDVPAADVERTIEVRLVEVTGRVTVSGRGAATRLVWHHGIQDVDFKADSDESGRYRMVLSATGEFRVSIEGSDFSSYFTRATVDGRDTVVTRDFDVPSSRVEVVVRDAPSGSALEGARVLASWTPRPGDGGQEFTVWLTTGADGRVQVPPVAAGTLEFVGRAAGHREASREISVTGETGGIEVELRLEKGSGTRFRVLGPDGRSSPGALVAANDAVVSNPAGADGIALIEDPLSPGQVLFAFVPTGHLVPFRWDGTPEQSVRASVTSPPFIVRFRSPEGRPLAARHVQLVFDGASVPMDPSRQRMLGWNSGSQRDGTHRIAGLPADREVTLAPLGRPDLAVYRRLPVTDTIEFTLDR